jgi:hypothetical protein
VVQTKRRPDLAMLAGWVCSEEARPRRQGPIGIVGEAARAVQSAERTACDGNADRARTFQGCLLRNRSQAQKTAGVKPALLLPFVRMHPGDAARQIETGRSLNPGTGLFYASVA